jgi:hypothetical protein
VPQIVFAMNCLLSRCPQVKHEQVMATAKIYRSGGGEAFHILARNYLAVAHSASALLQAMSHEILRSR